MFALIGVTVFDIVVYALYYFHQRQEKKKKKEINEVVIFHSGFMDCKRYCPGAQNAVECSQKSIQKLMHFVESCKTSIDICLYFFTSQELADTVIRCMKKRHITVRIIVDSANKSWETFPLSELLKNGGVIRYKTSNFIMHHKFILVDRKLLISGSCNWTNNALYANLENVIITSKESIVKKFVAHFDDLWEQFG